MIEKNIKGLPKHTFHTLINECERSGLKSISPHLEFINGSDSLSAESSGCLLPATYGRHKKTN
jgi:hypothetical protein